MKRAPKVSREPLVYKVYKVSKGKQVPKESRDKLASKDLKVSRA